MKLIFFLLILTIFFSACNNTRVKDTHSTRSVADSLVGAGKDTTRVKHDRHKGTAEENPGGDLTSIFDEYVSQYKKPCTIDSIFTFGTDTFQMHLKHYCLVDSAIKVPRQYVQMYKLDSFVTHNFATIVRLDKNNKTILQRTVYKKDFEKFLYPQLKEYGALLCPEMNLSKGTIELDYSISIPLTDVGVGVSMIVNPDGTTIYNNR